MDKTPTSRRDFLTGAGSAFGLALVASHWPAIAAAHAHAAVAAADPGAATLGFLAGDDARDVEAIAAQIIPTDDSPGAREAGALYFIDRSLQTWQATMAENFRHGLKDFQQGFAAAHPGPRFADADSGTQISFLTSVESSDFFGGVRALTLIGLFALPQYGGNRDGIGWRLIGFSDQHAFSPPFGYYDRDYPGFTRPESKT
jgi:gluconate 2-dehydrogenase gamma chain